MVKVPLRVLVTDAKLLAHETFKLHIEALQKQGHEVVVDSGELLKFDFIAGPNCWYVNPNTFGLFKLAWENARKVANADTKRIDKQATKKAAARAAKPKRKAGKGSRKSQVAAGVEEQSSSASNTTGGTVASQLEVGDLL